MALYSEKVMDHFLHPRNVGVIEDANAIGEVGNAKCGDIMKMYMKIENDTIQDVKFETFGCGSAIASSSMATEMIKGKPVSEAMKLTNKAVTEALTDLNFAHVEFRPAGPQDPLLRAGGGSDPVRPGGLPPQAGKRLSQKTIGKQNTH